MRVFHLQRMPKPPGEEVVWVSFIAAYAPLASQNNYPFIVYSVAILKIPT